MELFNIILLYIAATIWIGNALLGIYLIINYIKYGKGISDNQTDGECHSVCNE